MLKWAFIFFLIAIGSGILGFTGIAASAAYFAKIIFVIFFFLVLIFGSLGLTRHKRNDEE